MPKPINPNTNHSVKCKIWYDLLVEWVLIIVKNVIGEVVAMVSLCVYIHLCDLNNPTLFKNCNEIQQLKISNNCNNYNTYCWQRKLSQQWQ